MILKIQAFASHKQEKSNQYRDDTKGRISEKP